MFVINVNTRKIPTKRSVLLLLKKPAGEEKYNFPHKIIKGTIATNLEAEVKPDIRLYIKINNNEGLETL